MPEELTALQKEIKEQIFLDPATFNAAWSHYPFHPFWRTNNFIQRSMAYLFALDTTQKPEKWIPLEVDSQGRLEVSSIATGVTTANKVWTGTEWVNMSGTGAGYVNTQIVAPLPAGNNNIGNVGVLTLPSNVIAGMTSLPAGNNNIGDVDVVSLPPLPAGNNHIGNVDVVSLPDVQKARSATFSTSAVLVGETATLIKAANSARKELWINNVSTVDVYIGGATVTTTSGIKIPPDSIIIIDTTTAAVYGIVATGTADVRVVEI